MMSPEVIAIGEALVEIMRPSAGVPLDQTGAFQGPFASGAPAIFAVAAARIGLRVGFVGQVGEDAFGRLLQKRLESEGVNTEYLQVSKEYATSTAFVAYSVAGGREFVFHLRHAAAGNIDPRGIQPGYFSSIKWLHISGSFLTLSDACRKACSRAVELTRKAGGKVSFDPNLRPELMRLDECRKVYAPYLDAADLLLPTADEACLLSGCADEAEAARKLQGDAGRLVVFKRGAGGSTSFAPGKRLDVAGFQVEEVDPTGAGDCFNAACLAGLMHAWDLERTARFANAAGALAVTRQGPMEGAPTLAEIERLIR
jgi:sugar/nucleoside kinase (ribokinase family)